MAVVVHTLNSHKSYPSILTNNTTEVWLITTSYKTTAKSMFMKYTSDEIYRIGCIDYLKQISGIYLSALIRELLNV